MLVWSQEGRHRLGQMGETVMNLPCTGTDEELRDAAISVLDIREGCQDDGFVTWQAEPAVSISCAVHRLTFMKAVDEARRFIHGNDPHNELLGVPVFMCCGEIAMAVSRTLPWYTYNERWKHPNEFGVFSADMDVPITLLYYPHLPQDYFCVVIGRHRVQGKIISALTLCYESIAACECANEKLVRLLRRPTASHLPPLRRFWAYLKNARYAYLGWSIAFVLSVLTPEITFNWKWFAGQAIVLSFITALCVGIQWVMDKPRTK